jgi:hypothetical protein
MVFKSQAQAKLFFIDKILFQAQKDRISLSEAEQYMLGWTETEGGFELNRKLIDEFDTQTIRENYEKAICALIRHAYDTDISNDPAMSKTYNAAYRTLNHGDHYLLVMIKQTFQEIRADHKSDLWLTDKLLLIMTALGIAVPFVAALYFQLSREWYNFLAACVFFYLIPFSIYSYMAVKTARKKGNVLSKMENVSIPILISIVSIVLYVYLIDKFNIIELRSHSFDHAGFRFIVAAPLLIFSICLLDFSLKRGLVYDGVMGYIDKLRQRT